MKLGKVSAAWRWTHRYISFTLMVVVASLAYVLFFNDNSVMRTYQYEREIERIRAEIRDNRDSLEYYTELNRRLNQDPAIMEKVVRENYHMQRPSEDLFLEEAPHGAGE